MSYAENPYRSFGMVAAEAAVDERTAFIRKTYTHLAGAILAFAGIEALAFTTGLADRYVRFVGSYQWGWAVMLGAFILVSWLAETWARSATSVGTQYLGLSLYVVAEAVIFVPILYFASSYGGENLIPAAGMITLIMFGGLTAIVLISKHDFSYLRMALGIGSLAAFGLIICAMIFGFSLGIFFTVAMIALACGWILYDTSNVLHHYRIGQHVAASLALFASVALLFWYVIRLLMALQSRD